MAKFIDIQYKNINSVGNSPIKLSLVDSQTTLIGGSNGSGKSTLGLALSFSLFGKFPSGVNLADAINSVNKKNLEVQITFEQRGDIYKVIRGVKPKKFEIYKNDEMLDQNANARDQQKILDSILGMDYQTFVQVVMLNKEKYVPFMEMSANDRRKVVEEILGIGIFSVMNEVVKDESKQISSDLKQIENEVRNKNAEISMQNKLFQQIQESIDTAQNKQANLIEDKETELKSCELQAEDLNSELNALSLDGYTEVKKMKRDLELLSYEFDKKVKDLAKTVEFYENNDICPTCKQDIPVDLKNSIKSKTQQEIDTYKKTASEMITKFQSVTNDESNFKKIEEQINSIKQKINVVNNTIKILTNDIRSLSRDTGDIEKFKEKLDNAVTEYETMKSELEDFKSNFQSVSELEKTYNGLKSVLKDDGLKSIIIKEYIDLMNVKINEYLNAMGFYINIKLDENFKESFHAIHKENFSMTNLSTGQKARVNLAILLALLEVASIKNSVVSNVLFLDEILEPLDAEGVKSVVELFKEKLFDKNIFVISQRFDEFNEYFESSIRFKQNNGFTEIEKSC